ncbi:aminomethyl-transferring glycine dehydrogenase [Hymenobacter jeollabukensis]|uniref:Glycine dehydrogenase (decarboxylating) n=1 Tax=Hymenobacter jeollabukensis TaxID=2025313 RepID=A0A5R8WS99_9BACT|nr:aminomethyl-transferring glycine dehydrogenase [Hymenobacter jeollabukensis]TLM94055.1 aminomethyl-transferring glycine dehydrogenase [Hymenobacter jeollabukensis]
MKLSFKPADVFVDRHNGPDAAAVAEMLRTIGVESVDQLINETVPARIRLKHELNLPAALTERQFLHRFKQIAGQNKVFRSFIGLGYHDTQLPPVILRNIMENPGWYTAYTPYQAEIAQGRLEALINYQTMVIDLTGLEIANASLLDEGTAAAEALHMFHGLTKKKNATKFFVSEQVLPQTIDVLRTRATPLGIELIIGDHRTADLADEALFGAIVQYPAADGEVFDYTDFISQAHDHGIMVAVAADLLALTLLTPPGEMGADAVVGNSQRFGVPLGYGGPHAGFLATKDAFKRVIPGRIIGQSVDAAGNKAYRMALQTREQHIRREKATSNICTAQVLLSVIAGMYAVYHGPQRLTQIASNVHLLTRQLSTGLQELGLSLSAEHYFDTVSLALESAELSQALKTELEANGINLRYFGESSVGISLHEKAEVEDVADILRAFAKVLGKPAPAAAELVEAPADLELNWPQSLIRTSEFLTHPVFNTHHAEHELLRYMKQLENKDLSLAHSMISLGSCTMKLNATAEMIPVTWPEIGQLHPFAPREQAQGYAEIFKDLEAWLCEVTGFDAVSLQPNSGAQGEYAGLLVIKAYHEARGDHHRNVALIPASAHGTNPASAAMCGMNIVVVKSTEQGEIDLDDLKEKAEKHSANLSCLMVTYPSTHGVYEESIIDICNLIHEHGGRVYMDGANMNAQVGLTSPANIGADVCHLNLHKTFCIPHGGGGPGVGPIGVVADLAPYLPGHVVVDADGRSGGAVSAAPWGSASILPISYAYIAMMGGEGLKAATQTAILNANYLKARLEEHYPVLYTGAQGRVAHEMILECRHFKKAGIEVEDIAKRLMDYGFHAPTVSFPVAGTLMVEPTESEGKEELDRFCEAMIKIRQEIREVEEGRADAKDNPLKHAPHTAAVLLDAEWTRPYSREQAAYPTDFARRYKFWPSVSRIDSAFGDRNLICACTPIEAYADQEEHLVPTDKGPSY